MNVGGGSVTWQEFIVRCGRGALTRELAVVVGQPEAAVRALRAAVPCAGDGRRQGFVALFSRWRGRSPREDEWPIPSRARRGYVWQAPELALVARLAGRVSTAELAAVLTARLRERTGDPKAVRDRPAVQGAANRLSVRLSDLVGGLTVRAAGRRLGSQTVVQQAVAAGRLRSFRVGRRYVIPRRAFEAFLAARDAPPAGWVRLTTLRPALGIRSDSKLPEYAKLGHIPQTVFVRSSHAWFIAPEAARRILADVRRGRPLPWHGKPLPGNTAATWRKWRRRRHRRCRDCRRIWRGPAPRSFAEFARRYPPLSYGAKRHLTRQLWPGLSTSDAARKAGCEPGAVGRACRRGLLPALRRRGRWVIRQVDLTRWVWRGRPVGARRCAAVSFRTARRWYGLSPERLQRGLKSGELKTVRVAAGPSRGQVFLVRQPLAELARREGCSHATAARRLGMTVATLRKELARFAWRAPARVPEATMNALRNRLEGRRRFGVTIARAARAVRKTVPWVRAMIRAGVARPLRGQEGDALRLSLRSVEKLRAARSLETRGRPAGTWLGVHAAALHCHVSIGTAAKWGRRHEVTRKRGPRGWRYSKRTLERRARAYWRTCRWRFPDPPAWVVEAA